MNQQQKNYTILKQSLSRAFIHSGLTGDQGGVYAKQGGGSAIAVSPLSNCLGKTQNPSGCGGGLKTRLCLLELIIHDTALKNDSEGLRRALEVYSRLWVELGKEGVSV